MFERRELVQIHQRLSRIEHALDLIMRRLEIDPAEALATTDQVSSRVRQLALEGKVVDAVKQLRAERPELDLRAATQLVRALR